MRAISLCSGVGMMDLAAELSGITVALQCEIEPFCRAVLTKHWPDVPKIADIHDLRGDEVGTIDIIFGGIPCQPFSSNGLQRGTEDDRHLWPEAFRIIQTARPRWVCIENVDGFIQMAFDIVAADLESQGYEVWAAVLPACAIQAPHVRERAFIVAYSNGSRQGKLCRRDKERQPAITDGSKARILANTTGQRREWDTGKQDTTRGTSWCGAKYASGENIRLPVGVFHPNSPRQPKYASSTNSSEQRRAARGFGTASRTWLFESRLGRVLDGCANWLDGSFRMPAYRNQPQEYWEPPRVVKEKKQDHAKRLKAIGNGVVVPLLAEIFSTIVETDNNESRGGQIWQS